MMLRGFPGIKLILIRFLKRGDNSGTRRQERQEASGCGSGAEAGGSIAPIVADR